MKALSVLTLSLAITSAGCLHVPQGQAHLMGATMTQAPNPVQLASCEKTRTWHNVWVISGTILGGLAGAGGGVSGLDSDKNVQLGVGISAIVAGVMAAVSTAVAGVESDTYATNGCPAILQAQANLTFEAKTPTPVVVVPVPTP